MAQQTADKLQCTTSPNAIPTNQPTPSEPAGGAVQSRRPRLILRGLRKPSPLLQVTNMHDLDIGDNIDAQSRSSNPSPITGDDQPPFKLSAKRKGKQPVSDSPVGLDQRRIPADSESSFTPGSRASQDDERVIGDDTQSVITISSEPELKVDDSMDLSDRPWKKQKWNHETRKAYEHIFIQIYTQPMDASWEFTELYQREVDNEMQRYIEDYPFSQWAAGPEQAEEAFKGAVTRGRWRKIGVAVYGGSNGVSHPAQQAFAPAPVPHVQNPQMFHGSMPVPYPQALPYPQHPRAQNGAQLQVTGPNELAQAPHPQFHLAQLQPAALLQHPSVSNRNTVLQQDKVNTPTSLRLTKSRAPKTDSPAFEAPIPPYPVRAKPAERKPATKVMSGKQVRKQAEAEVFPWNRDLDYTVEKAKATWDFGDYDPKILQDMQDVREHNSALMIAMSAQDGNSMDKQKQARNNMTRLAGGSVEMSDGDSRPAQRLRKGEDNSQAGTFGFAHDEDYQRAAALEYKTPEEIIAAALAGQVKWEECKNIMICWHPDKKGQSEALEKATFRVYDTLVTQAQMHKRPIFTRRAAECMIDFCPHLLWRETLIRVQCEGGMGNKEIRNRFAMNGCWIDNSTFTKRILSALGQKQSAPKAQPRKADTQAHEEYASDGNNEPGQKKTRSQAGRYGPGEREWLESNQDDQTAYAAFFGKSISGRVASRARRSASVDIEDDSLFPATKRGRGRGRTGGRPSTSVQRVASASAVVDDGAASAESFNPLDAMDED